MRRQRESDEEWARLWQQHEDSMARVSQSVARASAEMERRERFWRAAGYAVGGLLGMWIYRSRDGRL